MSNYITTTNMSLLLPIPGVDTGPDWANTLNASLTQIDLHNHTQGYGVPITPLGLNINSDLSFLNSNATLLRTVRFQVQSPQPALSSDLGCLYVFGFDLYYRDVSGNQVRLTQSGGVAGSPGSITNLTTPATATWVVGTATFVWQSDTNTAANMDMRNAILRNSTASSYGLTLSPPAAMASDRTITFPTLPAATSLMTISSSGAIATTPIAAGQQLSATCSVFQTSSGSYVDVTNLSVTITTTGRPVFIGLIADGSSDLAVLELTGSDSMSGSIKVVRDSTDVSIQGINMSNPSAGGSGSIYAIPPSSVSHIDVVTAATYVYKIQAKVSGAILTLNYSKLIAYEV